MSAADITVVVLNYNTEEYTRQCLRSILDQSRSSAHARHVVVVDNGSRSFDRSALLLEFPEVEIIVSERNLGFGRACNLGAAGRSSRYLYFLNNDTVFLNDVLTVLAGYLETHPDAGLCGAQQFDGDLRPVRSTRTLPRLCGRPRPTGSCPPRSNWTPAPAAAASEPVDAESLSGANLFIRTELFREIGEFDERIFLYHEEDDLALRVRQHGERIVLLPQAKLQHFHAKSSPVKLSVLMEDSLSLIYFFEKHAGRGVSNLLRVLLPARFLVRWVKYRIRSLAGRDARSLAPVYARLLVWALSGYPLRTVADGRQSRHAGDGGGTVDRGPSSRNAAGGGAA